MSTNPSDPRSNWLVALAATPLPPQRRAGAVRTAVHRTVRAIEGLECRRLLAVDLAPVVEPGQDAPDVVVTVDNPDSVDGNANPGADTAGAGATDNTETGTGNAGTDNAGTDNAGGDAPITENPGTDTAGAGSNPGTDTAGTGTDTGTDAGAGTGDDTDTDPVVPPVFTPPGGTDPEAGVGGGGEVVVIPPPVTGVDADGNGIADDADTDSGGAPVPLGAVGTIGTLTLVNADTNQDIQAIEEGDTIDLNAIGTTNVNIRADVNAAVGSVLFTLNGQNMVAENKAPYALFADADGDYNAGTLPSGENVLIVTPFGARNASGETGVARTVTFNVVGGGPVAAPGDENNGDTDEDADSGVGDDAGAGDDRVIQRYVLVDARTDTDLRELRDGDTVDLSELNIRREDLTVRIETDDSVRSLRVSLDGASDHSRVEKVDPFYLFANNRNNARGNNGRLRFGENELQVSAHEQNRGRGDAIDTDTLNFNFVQGDGPSAGNGDVFERYVLVDARTDTDLGELNDGDTVVLSDLDIRREDLTVRIETDDSVRSLRVSLDGASDHSRVEKVNPFYLFANTRNDARPNRGRLNFGENELQVSAHDQGRGRGDPIATDRLTFTFVENGTGQPGDGDGDGDGDGVTVGTVTGVTLINADTDQAVAPITSGQTIDLATVGTNNVNVRADVSGQIESVRFNLNGEDVMVENEAPYALFADVDGDFNPGTLPAGAHTLIVTPFSGQNATGTAGTPLTVDFTVAGDDGDGDGGGGNGGVTVGTVTGVALINADTDQEVAPITSGQTIDLATVGTNNVNVRADVSGEIGSVQFNLNGEEVAVENAAPYALFADVDGNFNPGSLPAGTHTLIVTPFSGRNATGTAGTPLTVNFTVSGAPGDGDDDGDDTIGTVDSMTLVAANGQTTVINDGGTIDLSTIGGADFNMVANTTGTIGSVRFNLDGGDVRTDNEGPYSVFDDIAGGTLTPGQHTLIATPFSGDNATGTAGTPFTLNLTVTGTPPGDGDGDGDVAGTVTNLTLVNALTDQDLQQLQEGADIDVSTLGTNQLSVRADTAGQVQSVQFNLDDEIMVDDTAPYALFGGEGSDYEAGVFLPGTRTLTVTPFAGLGATGAAGTPVTISFDVFDLSITGPTPPIVDPPTTDEGSGDGADENGTDTGADTDTGDDPIPTPSPVPGPGPIPGFID